MRSRVATTAVAAVTLLCVPHRPLPQARGAPFPYELRRGGRNAPTDDPLRDLPDGEKTTSWGSRRRRRSQRSRSSKTGPTRCRRSLDGTPTGLSADGATLALIKPHDDLPSKDNRVHGLRGEKAPQGAGEHHAGGRLQPRRALARRQDAVSHRVHRPARPRRVPGALVRHRIARARPRADPRLRGRARRDARPAADTGTSADGRWEYTLYDGGEHPFIHALDVVDGATVCIDLEMIHAGRPTARSSR